MERRPIFIAGQERSGTSLIFALLTSHPRIAMTRRTNLWTHFYNQYGDLSVPENFERCLAMMMKYKRMRPLNPNSERIRREFWQGEPTYGRLFALLEEHYAEQVGKPRWGDKSLHTERYAGPIFEAYPEARILHMIRDPRDRYASALTRWKVSRGGVGAGTAVWLNSLALGRRNERAFPGRYRLLRYETLAGEPEATLRDICEFIGEDFAPEMLAMSGAKSFRDEGGNSSYGQHRPGRISTKSIGRFRQVLNPRQIALMQLFAGREMTALDYPLEAVRLSPGERLWLYLVNLPDSLARMGAWWTRELVLNQVGRPVPAYRIIPSAESQPVEASQ